MKNSLFNPDNWLWQPFSAVADVLILSCLWLICCIPILTAGAATAALYDCCARCIKDGDRALFSRFFRTFRRELLKSIPSVLLWAMILTGLVFLMRCFTGSAAGTDGLMIEVHNDPSHALCDGAQSLTPEKFAVVADKCLKIREVMQK